VKNEEGSDEYNLSKLQRFAPHWSLSKLASLQLLTLFNNRYLDRERFRAILCRVRKDLFDKSGNEKQRGLVSFIHRELAQNDPEHEKIYAIDFFRCCEVILIDYEVSNINSSIDLYKFVCENKIMQDFRETMRMFLESQRFEYVGSSERNCEERGAKR